MRSGRTLANLTWASVTQVVRAPISLPKAFGRVFDGVKSFPLLSALHYVDDFIKQLFCSDARPIIVITQKKLNLDWRAWWKKCFDFPTTGGQNGDNPAWRVSNRTCARLKQTNGAKSLKSPTGIGWKHLLHSYEFFSFMLKDCWSTFLDYSYWNMAKSHSWWRVYSVLSISKSELSLRLNVWVNFFKRFK